MDWLSEFEGQKVRALDFVPHALAGVAMVAGFAVMGSLMGQQAAAPSLPSQFADVFSPAAISEAQIVAGTRGSLLNSDEADIVVADAGQSVVGGGKGDFLMTTPQPRVIAASYNPESPEEQLGSGLSGATGNVPSIEELERRFSRAGEAKKQASLQRKFQQGEKSCLARAVYFEARSESELGQMAVAQVILNRVNDPAYPKTVCGVVYQGADRPNSCQFSFACDGLTDEPTNRQQWATAQRVAQKALSGNGGAQVVAAATHYHADYVKPKWSNSLRKIIQIGRHIFYADS